VQRFPSRDAQDKQIRPRVRFFTERERPPCAIALRGRM